MKRLRTKQRLVSSNLSLVTGDLQRSSPGLSQSPATSYQLPVTSLMVFIFALSSSAEEKTTYDDHVLPLIEANCAQCHNSDKKKGDLDLTSYSALLKGGGSGPVVVSGNPDSSKLWKAVTHAEDPTMPPKKPPLPETELVVFKKWIAGGLLEASGSKAIAAAKPSVDLSLRVAATSKPDSPPPLPRELSIEPVVHTARANPINGLAASPWAPLVALAGQKQILLYNTTNLDLLGILPFSEGQPWDLKFSRSGRLLLAGGGQSAKSGKVILWNIETGEPVARIGHEYDLVMAADLSPDQSKVALGGPGRLVKIYSTATGELLHQIKKHTDWVTALAFSPNGELLATGDRNGGLVLWDPDNGQELFTTAGHKGGVSAVSWRDDSKLVASSSEDGTVKLWDVSDGKQAKTWKAHNGGALCVAFNHDGQLVTAGRDGAIIIWSAEGARLKTCDFSGEMALRCAWTHDNSGIIASDFAGHVALWQAKDGRRLGDLDANPPPIADQILAAQKRVEQIQSRGDKPAPDLAAAEADVMKLELKTTEDRRVELATANALWKRLTLAQSQATLFKTRQTVSAKRREVESLQATLMQTRDEIARLTKELNAARDPVLKLELKNALKNQQRDLKTLGAQLKTEQADLAIDQGRLDKMASEFEQIRNASSPRQSQTKL